MGEGDEEGAFTGRGGYGDFGGEVAEVGDAERVLELGRDGGEGLEGWGVGLCGDTGVFVVVGYYPVSFDVGV